jgi:hypothetical protein
VNGTLIHFGQFRTLSVRESRIPVLTVKPTHVSLITSGIKKGRTAIGRLRIADCC